MSLTHLPKVIHTTSELSQALCTHDSLLQTPENVAVFASTRATPLLRRVQTLGRRLSVFTLADQVLDRLWSLFPGNAWSGEVPNVIITRFHESGNWLDCDAAMPFPDVFTHPQLNAIYDWQQPRIERYGWMSEENKNEWTVHSTYPLDDNSGAPRPDLVQDMWSAKSYAIDLIWSYVICPELKCQLAPYAVAEPELVIRILLSSGREFSMTERSGALSAEIATINTQPGTLPNVWNSIFNHHFPAFLLDGYGIDVIPLAATNAVPDIGYMPLLLIENTHSNENNINVAKAIASRIYKWGQGAPRGPDRVMMTSYEVPSYLEKLLCSPNDRPVCPIVLVDTDVFIDQALISDGPPNSCHPPQIELNDDKFSDPESPSQCTSEITQVEILIVTFDSLSRDTDTSSIKWRNLPLYLDGMTKESRMEFMPHFDIRDGALRLPEVRECEGNRLLESFESHLIADTVYLLQRTIRGTMLHMYTGPRAASDVIEWITVSQL